jgi:hypothetical protein
MLPRSLFVLSALAAASYTCQAESELVDSQTMVAAINQSKLTATPLLPYKPFLTLLSFSHLPSSLITRYGALI